MGPIYINLSAILVILVFPRYIQEVLGLHDLDPMYRQFAKVFETFRITEPDSLDKVEVKKEEPVVEFKKAPKPIDEYDDEEDEEVSLFN